jgi:methionine synthase I (cobalamin-dependent)
MSDTAGVRAPILAALARGPLVLDAAMGTRLIARGLPLDRDDPALWNLSHAADVFDLHARDVAAGADAVLTNTFGANRRWLDRFGHGSHVEAINRRAVAIARAAAGPDRFVIGSIGPTACDDREALSDQADVLVEAGVDALLFETCRAEQVTTALKWVRPRVAVPVFVSLVEWPAPVDAIVRRLEDTGADVLGGNCHDRMAAALRMAEALWGLTRLPILVKPAAGLPGAAPAAPESFAAAVPALRALGVRLFGGCCGTTEAHVAALRAACYDAALIGSEAR